MLGYPGTSGRMWLKLHLGPVESRQDILKLRVGGCAPAL